MGNDISLKYGLCWNATACFENVADYFSHTLSDWLNNWETIHFDQSTGSSHGVKVMCSTGGVWSSTGLQGVREKNCAKKKCLRLM